MGTASARSAASLRQAYPDYILFEERDGIFWLRGQDLERAKKALRLDCDGAKAVGFPSQLVLVCIDQLLHKRLQVGVLCGNTVRTVKRSRSYKPCKIESATIGLAPELLFDHQELACMARSFKKNEHIPQDLMERLRSEVTNGHPCQLDHFGILYVYQVTEDLYEIDWELTTIPKIILEAKIVIAHQTRRMLRCRLVPPKTWRGKKQPKPKPVFEVGKPVTYGQLSLPLF